VEFVAPKYLRLGYRFLFEDHLMKGMNSGGANFHGLNAVLAEAFLIMTPGVLMWKSRGTGCIDAHAYTHGYQTVGAVGVLVDKSSDKICTGMDTGDSV